MHNTCSKSTNFFLLVSVSNKEVVETETSFLALDRYLYNGTFLTS